MLYYLKRRIKIHVQSEKIGFEVRNRSVRVNNRCKHSTRISPKIFYARWLTAVGSLFSEERSTGFQFWGFWRLALNRESIIQLGKIVNQSAVAEIDDIHSMPLHCDSAVITAQ